MDFPETIVVYDLKLATDDRSDKKFLLTSKLCPLVAVSLLLYVYIHVLNHENVLYKIRLQRDFFETCNKWEKDKAFLLTSKFCPLWAVCPCPRAIYMYQVMKKFYKIRLQRDFLKLAVNDRTDKRFLLASKFCPLGLSALICGYKHLLTRE